MITSLLSFLKSGGGLFALLTFALVLNHRAGYITIIGIFSILVFATITVRSRFVKGDILIIMYTICYVILSSLNGFSYTVSTLVLYAVAPFVFFQYGNNIVTRFKTDNFIIIAWLIIVFCYCLDIFIVTLNNIIETGQIIAFNRKFSLDGESVLSATLIGLSVDIGMIGLPMFILLKSKCIRVSFLVLFILSLITTFSLLNRTGIVVAALCFIIVIGFRARNDSKLLAISILCISVLIGLLLYAGIINTDLLELYNERNDDLFTMGTRTERWSTALGYLFTHPVGWANSGQIYYVHNMWLDVARISGIIPFILLAYMAFASFKAAFILVRKNESALSYMLLGLNVNFFASCFVEPIYGGTHFMLYCMLWGTSVGLLKR